MVDALVSGTSGASREGSSPFLGTIFFPAHWNQKNSPALRVLAAARRVTPVGCRNRGCIVHAVAGLAATCPASFALADHLALLFRQNFGLNLGSGKFANGIC